MKILNIRVYIVKNKGIKIQLIINGSIHLLYKIYGYFKYFSYRKYTQFFHIFSM